MAGPTERITRLRQHAIEQGFYASGEANLHWGRSWRGSSGERWHIIRRARATADVLRHLTPTIDGDELIVGKFARWTPTEDEQRELAEWAAIEAALPPVAGQRAHQAVDIERLLRFGVVAIRELIEGYRSELDVTRAEDLERDAFYRACLIALDGLVAISHRYADLAEEQASGASLPPQRRKELVAICEICRRVPEHPASTFWEALQAAHLLTFALCVGQRMLLFQLGRPDRYLLPFYRRDLVAGRITPERAQELIDCACLMLCEYTPRGLAVGFGIGGRDASGMDVCNELTEMLLESVDHVRLSYPGVALCWTDETPAHIMQRAAELLADGRTHPALFGDDVVSAGLRAAGVAPAESVLWIHSTCVEITPIASSNVYVASPYLNMVQLLHDVLGVPSLGGEWRAGADGIGCFEELVARFRRRLAEAVRAAVAEINTDQMTRRYHGGAPLQSCFVNDCLTLGRDIDHGGARHNWIEPVFVGTANLADALCAIRKLVFDEGRVGLSELALAMGDDFAGREDLRLMVLNAAPKYGNDEDAVDDLVRQITSWYVEECRKYQSYLGGTYQAGMFCWIQHGELGRLTAASADGRRAGTALADGAGAAQGRDATGPTAAVLSATKWDHRPMIGGIAVNIRFSPSSDGSALATQIRQVCETFLRRGGAEIQVNVVDRETLLDARVNPERHRDLIVRIAGYSDFFVSLPDVLQDEVITRSEHSA